MSVDLRLGDCLEVLPTIPDGSIDAIICDPPYPEISRDYGRMTEADWHTMMRGVVAESRRVLKPTGSAVFILQANSEKLGRMRPWLWEFMAWTSREWNMLQDAWWWNINAIPDANAIQGRLMRSSLKACVWLGDPTCFRDQDKVLWAESDRNKSMRLSGRHKNYKNPSGHHQNTLTATTPAGKRGGVTPFNVLPLGNAKIAGSFGHGAGTPEPLIDWWTRYIVPDDGTVLDPFMGSGTTGIVAKKRGLSFVGIEKKPEYFTISQDRIEIEQSKAPLLFA